MVIFFAGPQKITGGLHDSKLCSEFVRREDQTVTAPTAKSLQESLVAKTTLSELHRSIFKLQHASVTVKHDRDSGWPGAPTTGIG
jgi:hypothetical protein